MYLKIKRYIKLKLLKISFKSSNYWESRYKNGGNSGAGSYNQIAKFKTKIINDFIKKENN